MQKSVLLLSSLSAIVAMNLVLSSCKDDEPFVKPKLSLSESTMTVGEAAGTIEVVFQLDKAYSKDIVVEYDLGGTATEGSGATADYEVQGDFGEVEINAGQTTATLKLAIKSDASFEGNETIEVSIDDVNDENIDITNDDEVVITITDDDPQITASFATATLNVNEDDGILNLVVSLSQAAPSTVTLQYTLTGTARDSVTAVAPTPDLPADYAIRGGTPGTLTIPSGASSGTIRLGLYSDFDLEDNNPETPAWDPEQIIITLTQASTGVIVSTTNAAMQINVTQQDGKIIALVWDEDTDVDMDLFLWIGTLGAPVGDLDLITLSAFESTEPPELVFIPNVITNASFGAGYTYFEGTVTPLEFEVQFADFTNLVVEPVANRDVFTASYTLANINRWTDDGAPDPAIVQTFNITAGVYSTPTAITVPASGSRFGSPSLSLDVVKGSKRPPAHITRLGNKMKK